MTSNSATAAALLKNFYTSKRVEEQVFKNAPLFAMLQKKADLEGDLWVIPLVTSNPQAGSGDFAIGQANAGATGSSAFKIETAYEYSFARLTRKLMKKAKTNKGAFLNQSKLEVDGSLNVNKQSMGIQLYGNGDGSRGDIASVSGSTITLESRHDAVKFPKGMKIQILEPGVGLRDSGNQLTVAGANFQTGVITFTTGVTATVTGATVSDKLVRAGDYGTVLTGLDGWNPKIAPTGGDSFWTVDRSSEPDKLAGIRYDGSGQSVKEALIFAQSEVNTLGDGVSDHVFMHPSQYRALCIEIGDQVRPQRYDLTAKIGFQGVEVQGDVGVMRVFPDRYCPAAEARVLQLDTWELGSEGPCPEIFDKGSDQEMLRLGDADAYEVRTGGYPQLGCHAPGKNCVVTLDLQD